jgi:hypothetical protein
MEGFSQAMVLVLELVLVYCLAAALCLLGIFKVLTGSFTGIGTAVLDLVYF